MSFTLPLKAKLKSNSFDCVMQITVVGRIVDVVVDNPWRHDGGMNDATRKLKLCIPAPYTVAT